MMINVKSLFGGVCGSALSFMAMSMSTSEVADIVSIVTGVLGLLITLIAVIIIPVIRWYAKAKKDGKIDIDEINELADTLQQGVDKVSSKNKKEGGKE